MENEEKQQEHHYLERVIRKIHQQLAVDRETWQGSRGEFQDILTSFWENRAANFWDQAQLAEAVDRQRSLVASSWQRQARLQRMLDAPYFGRIDFAEKTARNENQLPEAIYIGIAALADGESGAYLIYDWRSPIAGMFYDFETGPAWYDCPAGRIAGQITLKRQYQIEKGRMKSMFDTDLKIDDEILQEILAKNTDLKMKTIVNSIQREQNRAIRDESHRLLFVQGPAGSGKTSIALHRAAYLLYRERDSITAKNILILSPNRIFSDYISGVLPALGEENVLQTTFGEYVGAELRIGVATENRDDHLEQILGAAAHGQAAETADLRAAAIRYKSSPDFMKILQKYLLFLHQKNVADAPAITFRGHEVVSREEWIALYRENLAYLPPCGRLAQIKQRVQVKLRPFVKELRREKEEAIAATGEEVNEKTIKAMARISARRELEALEAELDRLTTLEPFQLYCTLFNDPSLFQNLSAATGKPAAWHGMARLTLNSLHQGMLPYEDIFPFLYFQGLLRGFRSQNEIRHLIVDEAQDYSALQYEILKQLFPRSFWTVLGDPEQAVHPYLQTADYQELANLWGSDNSEAVCLRKSYRSTGEIQLFCQALLENPNPPEIMQRSGALPLVVAGASRQGMPGRLARMVTELQQRGYRSVAVICKTAREAETLYETIPHPEQLGLKRITREAEEFQHGNLIIPVYLAKGLEFDAVIVPDASARVYHRATDRKLLYIACTRALHHLVLFCPGAAAPFLGAVAPGKYRKMDAD